MKWFKFRQNNSFGHFVGTPLVFIQAYNAEHANDIARHKGIYFNGVADGIDCDCCGDRWFRVCDDDAQDQPSSYGYDGSVTVYSDGDNYTDYSGKVWKVRVLGGMNIYLSENIT
jgi:hypothetical protein